jgi:uncharacterized membrane protein YgcG
MRCLVLALLVASWPSRAPAQEATAPTFSEAELEQVVAPIALYPDALLAQVLMASTYPLEVVEAARFAKENPKLEGKALDQALQGKTWDASVKSLVSFQQVLEMMNQKLDWTQKLGDAFLAQQSDVMDAVQRLRAKAKAEGNLESNEQQKVIVEQAPAPPAEVVVQQAPPTIIKIEPANPQVVYVPTYNPTVVYGAWPYPTYPPYYYYPPGYVAGASLISFGFGMAMGAALWGDCDWGWGHGDVDIDVNEYNSYSRNVNREWNKTEIQNKFQDGKWKHDPSHRKGVQYRDKATQQRFDRAGPKNAASREAFRGRAEQGRQQIAREGTAGIQRDPERGRTAGQQRPGGASDRMAGQQRPSATRDRAAASQRAGAGRASSLDRGRGSGAFQGIGHGKQVRRDSSRGHASRASAGRGSRGGGSRGGSRGGGGIRR